MNIDISDLDRAAVLAALFNGARAQGLGFVHHQEGNMTVEQAQAILDTGTTDFDYLQGRVLKVDLSGDSFDPWGYDRDNGEGAAHSVIRSLRQTGSASNVETAHLHQHGMAASAENFRERYGDELAEVFTGTRPPVSES
jgi:hypothetical protein